MPATDRIAVAYVHGAEVAHSWHQSMQAMIAWDLAHHQRVIGGGWFATRYGTGGIVQARNDTAHAFLTQTDAEWLFIVDTDMGFAPDSVDRLFEAAHADERPIMGGLCFALRETQPDNAGGYLIQPQPTIYDWAQLPNGQSGFYPRLEYERSAVLRVAGTGSAFVLIHRSVLERIEAEYGRSWYSPVFNTSLNATISEDLSFCSRAGALGIPIHINTDVRVSHMKYAWWDERMYDRLERIDRPEGTHVTPPGT